MCKAFKIVSFIKEFSMSFTKQFSVTDLREIFKPCHSYIWLLVVVRVTV